MLTVTESGKGTPLVLLHGWGLHSGVWESILPELEKNFHCYAVDMLGHGESQASSNKPFSLENMCSELHDIINSINSNDIILLGWSLGGLVAVDYLKKHNEKIKKCILVTSNACFCKKDNWQYALDDSVLENFSQQLEQDYKKTVDKFMALQMFGADDYKQALKVLKHSITDRPEPSMESLREGLKILKETDLLASLSNISQPTLMITGEKDRLMPYQAAEEMQPLFKKAQCHMIKGAGHAPFISHPIEFITAIKHFTNEPLHV